MSKPLLQISLATPADLPSIFTCGSLAFSSSFLIHVVHPDRARLIKEGIDPRNWPDFNNWLKVRSNDYKNGSVFIVAKIDEEIVGYTKLEMPTAMLEEVKKQPAFAERFSEDEFKRVLEDARNKNFSDEPIGVNAEALKVFEVGQAEVTKKHPDINDSYYISTMAVHPHFQRMGVGMALMSRVNEIADSSGTPIYIRDATDEALPLYLKNGFKQVDTMRFEYEDVVVDYAVLFRPGKKMEGRI
ncbi:hypothetical protein AAF712_010752 [Marasmius tenuissimus]|uniref:N-acetyltransferase domain-containing protein n=1 Tax=Marasmius tenuissimus TaxID=585030 RepID=A0ABR2ZL34_9AGAR